MPQNRQVRLRFTVQDTGPGIVPEDLERIFHDFEQADVSVNRCHGGTGLGLAISRRLVELMDGEIHVSSVLGEGSVFSFEITLTHAKEAVSIIDMELQGYSVAILSHAVMEAPRLAARMMAAGARVDRFDDADSAARWLMDMADAGSKPVILCDLAHADEFAHVFARTPQMSGFRRIIMLLAGERCHLDRLRDMGFDAYLIRPVRLVSLFRQIRDVDDGAGRDVLSIAPTESDNINASKSALCVLLAEDNEVNARLTIAVLERQGHDVVHVKDGVAALEALRRRGASFDIVLMDVNMPEMDGIDATRHIRTLGFGVNGEGAGTVPVIALTASAFEEDRQTCFDAGMDDYLSKPFMPEDIIRVLKRWAGRRSHMRGDRIH